MGVIKICGIAGVMFGGSGEVGSLMTSMLKGLQHRGLDSAGVAFFHTEERLEDEYIIRVFTRDVVGALSKVSTAIAEAGGDIRNIEIKTMKGYGFDRYIIKARERDIRGIVDRINSTELSKVLSVGRSMDIIKDATSVEDLEANFQLGNFRGSHAIGHVRFSTESNTDLLHAHPFQSFDHLDVALVHNGQITNYWKSREKMERRGFKFQTGNDSELIVHYLIEKLKSGDSLGEALGASVDELDGPFSYIVSTSGQIGMVRDKLGLRPMVVLEGNGIRAVASEESALRMLGKQGVVRNIKPGEGVVWSAK